MVPLNGRSRSIIINRLGTRNQIALIQFPQKAGAVIGTGQEHLLFVLVPFQWGIAFSFARSNNRNRNEYLQLVIFIARKKGMRILELINRMWEYKHFLFPWPVPPEGVGFGVILVLSSSLSLALFPMLSAGNEEGGGERNHYIYELVVYNQKIRKIVLALPSLASVVEESLKRQSQEDIRFSS